jgi:hypothetical protein
MAEVMPSGGNNTHPLGRGLQGADNKAGNSGVKTESETSDLRDPTGGQGPIHAHRVPPPVRPGRGLHDSSKIGG